MNFKDHRSFGCNDRRIVKIAIGRNRTSRSRNPRVELSTRVHLNRCIPRITVKERAQGDQVAHVLTALLARSTSAAYSKPPMAAARRSVRNLPHPVLAGP